MMESGTKSGATGKTVDPEVLADIVRRVVEVASPEKIILFGSAARGEMGPHNDVDLLISAPRIGGRPGLPPLRLSFRGR